MTSRWVVEAASLRNVPVRWRTYSLAVKNAGSEASAARRALAGTAHGALRSVEAVWADHGDEPIGRLYTEIGNRFHLQQDNSPGAVSAAIEAAGLDPSYAAADERWDEAIRQSMADAIKHVGDEVGVPILVFHDEDRAAGISGPIMSPAVTGELALALWDNVVGVAWTPNVFELKRARTTGPQL